MFVLLAVNLPANAQSEIGTNQGRPGNLNYVEGRVLIGNDVVDPKSVGSAEVEEGQSITTERGKAELLLTPGAFLRLGDNTSVKMISTGLTNTEVQVKKGRALIEVAEIHRENNLRVDLNGVMTEITKKGLYVFDADSNQLRVFDGKALVQRDSKQVEVKDGHAFILNAPLLKAEKFDEKSNRDDLYNWSSLRSKYLAEANTDAARTYVGGGLGWWGTGWYWDPWFGAYTFIPGSGFIYSPFGWGFYSPALVYRSPFIYYGGFPHRYYGGYWVRGYRGFRGPAFSRGGGFVRGGGFHGGGFRR
ncbi:MAG: FecR domain-containing protein [Blastocatellia bacterium]|nr:FecR domain-containing protein [Blastocatellia bacterium]